MVISNFAGGRGLTYRPGVGAVLFNGDGRVWIGRRATKSDPSRIQFWQMPQGGIDDGETPSEAVIRELAEETGTDKAEVIAETRDWLTYDLPEHLIGVAWDGGYRGQIQKWFALRFTGDARDFDLERHDEPEFTEWRWARVSELPNLIVPFKRRLYQDILTEFAHLPDVITSAT